MDCIFILWCQKTNSTITITFTKLKQQFKLCSRGVMDSTMVFGTISSGSNPDGSAKVLKNQLCYSTDFFMVFVFK